MQDKNDFHCTKKRKDQRGFRGFRRLCSSCLQQILTASRKLLISSHQILPAQTRPAWLQSNTFLKRWNNIYAITWSNFTDLQLWLTRTSSLPTRTHSVEQSNRKTKRLNVLHAVQQKAASSFHLQHTHMFLKHCGRTLHFVTNIALPGHPLLTKICLQHRLLKKQTKKEKKKRGWGKFWIKRLFLHQSFNN